MIAKPKKGESHVQGFKKLFKRLKKYKLRPKLAKYSFEIKFGKLLGFMVSERWIKVDPDKVKLIQSMSSPTIEKKVRGFWGRLNYIT